MKRENIVAATLLGAGLVLTGCATAPRRTAVPAPQLVPLESFWNGHDRLTTASSQVEASAVSSGYRFVRIEGYIFADPQTGTVPLEQYWSKKRRDNMLLGTPLSVTLKKNAGYELVRVEGYVYPKPQPGTVPLTRFKLKGGDNYTTATAQGEREALATGYTANRVEGYVFPAPLYDDVGKPSPR
jgi:hypothetical protein